MTREREIENGRPVAPLQVIYVAPMKALVRERIKDWGTRLRDRLGTRCEFHRYYYYYYYYYYLLFIIIIIM